VAEDIPCAYAAEMEVSQSIVELMTGTGPVCGTFCEVIHPH
jgi:hypothetical protein